MSGYTEAEERAMVEQFSGMSNGQFLYMLADGFDGPGIADRYIADRLALMAVVITACEVITEVDHGQA